MPVVWTVSATKGCAASMSMPSCRKAREAGFQLMIPPVLVRPDIMAGTGFLGQHSEEIGEVRAVAAEQGAANRHQRLEARGCTAGARMIRPWP